MAVAKSIELALKPLVGLALTRATRAAEMECLKFGEKITTDSATGEELNIGAYGLHLQCPWRIVSPLLIGVGSDNLYDHPNSQAGYIPGWSWDGNVSARDVLTESFIRNRKSTVARIKADIYGGFEIYFEDNSILQVFPAKATNHGQFEHWRLLNNQTNEEHFVVDNELVSRREKHPNSR